MVTEHPSLTSFGAVHSTKVLRYGGPRRAYSLASVLHSLVATACSVFLLVTPRSGGKYDGPLYRNHPVLHDSSEASTVKCAWLILGLSLPFADLRTTGEAKMEAWPYNQVGTQKDKLQH